MTHNDEKDRICVAGNIEFKRNEKRDFYRNGI